MSCWGDDHAPLITRWHGFWEAQQGKEICINKGNIHQATFTRITRLCFVLQAFRCGIKPLLHKVDSSIPRRALGNQHGDTLTQTVTQKPAVEGKKCARLVCKECSGGQSV